MQKKAQDYVTEGMSTVNNAVTALKQAASMAEKSDNRAKIEQAISDLNCACNHLSGYRD